MSAPHFAAILDTHEWTWAKRDRASGDGVLLGCSGCDWTHEPSGATGLGWTPHHAHVADLLTTSLDAVRAPSLPFTLRVPTDRAPNIDGTALNTGINHVDVQVIHDPHMALCGECRHGYGGPVIALRAWNEQVFLHELLHVATGWVQPRLEEHYPPHGHEVLARLEVALWETGWRLTNRDLDAVRAQAKAEALREAADEIQAMHPGEVKNSVMFLRARADQHAPTTGEGR
jgi:hypothetical protein